MVKKSVEITPTVTSEHITTPGRKKPHIRRAAAIIAIAAASSTLAACAPSENPIYATYALEEIPPIEDIYWYSEDSSAGMTQIFSNEVATALPSPASESGYTIFYNDSEVWIPEEYKHAFEVTLEEPIVQYAAESGAVDEFTITTSKYDNGYFRPDDESVGLTVSNGQGDVRLYDTTLGFVSTGIHEATHGLANSWYRVAQGEATGNHFGDKLDAVYEACDVVRDEVFHDFVEQNRTVLADAFQKTADGFSQALETNMTNDGRLLISEQRTKLPGYISALQETADAIRADDPRIYDRLNRADDGCGFVDVFEIPYSFTDSMGAYYEYPEANPIWQTLPAQTKAADEAYACIKDGNAVADLVGVESSPGGHAYDNPTETIASMVASAVVNPTYVMECMQDLQKAHPERAEDLWKLMNAVWNITLVDYPELRTLVTTSPSSKQLIEQVESR